MYTKKVFAYKKTLLSFFFFFIISFLPYKMLSTSIKESNFNSTKSKQIQTILPYGKHLKGLEENLAKKSQEDVCIFFHLQS